MARTRASPILAVLNGERQAVPPVWLMRQAGRYLPEYRALRAEKGGFLDLVYDSASAAEVTLQPIRRFDFDAAILFSDILVIPHALGQDLWFEEGEGPRLATPLAGSALDGLTAAPERLAPVYETVRYTRAELPAGKALLGFAGSPWTVATYMIAGRGSRDQADARTLAYRDPIVFARIIDAIIDQTIAYLRGQIDAGADAVQLFDSWAGSLAPEQFEKWVLEPTRRIVDALRQSHPTTPVIGFPKGIGGKLARYAETTGIAAIGIDETIDPVWADAVLPKGMPVQGNLDPIALLAGGTAMEAGVARVLDAFAHRPHIFNLGHGILQQTPIDHVHAMLKLVRGPRG